MAGAAFALALCGPMAALAHPHVFVDAKAEIVFDSQGRMTAVRNIWRFDPAFSAFASQGLDKNRDGKLSNAELAPLAKTNVESLNYYGFFTRLSVGGRALKLKFPDRYFLRASDHQLTLYYELPLETPARAGPKTVLEIYDPEYFVAFTFVKKDPITLLTRACRLPSPISSAASVGCQRHDETLGNSGAVSMTCPRRCAMRRPALPI